MSDLLVYLFLSIPLIGAFAMFAMGISVIYRASRALNLAPRASPPPRRVRRGRGGDLGHLPRLARAEPRARRHGDVPRVRLLFVEQRRRPEVGGPARRRRERRGPR